MPVVSPNRFSEGLTWPAYLAGCTSYQEDRQNRYKAITFSPEQEEALERLRPQGLKVLVLEEPWCGDAARSGPVLARVAEAAGMEARWFLRDQNLDIMDQYLENGTSRSIPVFVFMDRNGEYLTHWGSRPAAVKAAKATLPPLPAREDPAFAGTLDLYHKMLGEAYDRDYPEAIVAELLERVGEATRVKSGSGPS